MRIFTDDVNLIIRKPTKQSRKVKQ